MRFLTLLIQFLKSSLILFESSLKPRTHNLIILFEKFLHNNYPGIINLRKVELPKSKTAKLHFICEFS